MKSRSILTLAAALLAAAAPIAFAQEQPPEATQPAAPQSFGEEISVNVVNLEVWVSDGKGHPVPGLSKDDFQLFEDGKPVEVSNFSSFSTRTPGAGEMTEAGAAAPAAPAPAPAAPAAELAPDVIPVQAASPENRLYLSVLFDNWTVRPEDRDRVIDALRDFLDHRLGPNDKVMIAVHDRSIQLVQPFTSDRQALARALDRVARGAPSGIQLRSERRSAMNAIREAYQKVAHKNAVGGFSAGQGPCIEAWGDMQAAAMGYAARLQGVYEQSGGALASMAQILAGVPGRKMVVYAGGALEQSPGLDVFHYLAELCPDQQSNIALQYTSYDVTWLYEEVAKRANAAGVTFYMLEAATPGGDEDLGSAGPIGSLTGFSSRGGGQSAGSAGGGQSSAAGTTGAVGGASNRPSGSASHGQTFRPSTTLRRFGETNKEDGFVYIAHETGGRAILDAGDFKPELTRLASDLRSYYSLGFTPDHRGDGKVHHLEVKIPGRHGYELHYRRSYVDEPVDQRMAERVRGVAQFGIETNPLGVRIETGKSRAAAGGTFRVPVRLWVPLSSLTLVPGKGGPSTGRLRLLMAYSDAQGKLGPVRQKEVTLAVKPGAAGEAGAAGGGDRLIEVDLELAPGDHQVAVGVRDELGGEVSYLRHHLDVGPGAPEQTPNHPR